MINIIEWRMGSEELKANLSLSIINSIIEWEEKKMINKNNVTSVTCVTFYIVDH